MFQKNETNEQPTMRMVEIEYLEWAWKRTAIFESLRRVARAAKAHKDTDWEFDPEHSLDGLLSWAEILKALDALPGWVLDTESE